MSGHVRRFAPEAACFVLVATAYGVHFALSGYDRFYHDAAEYWQLGEVYGADGRFSLLAYDDRFRGYSLPLLNYGLQQVGSLLGIGDVTVVQIFGALLASTLGVLVLPRLASELFSGAAVGWGRVLALNALVFLFWRDHFNFPLSDFPTLLAASIGLIGLLRASLLGYAVAGLGFGIAANMRPAYLLVAILVVVAAAFVELRRADWRGGVAVGLVVAGLAAATLPQVAINDRHHDTWSPTPSDSREIAMVQLTAGLYAQKYETYVGSRDVYPRARVFYSDPAARDVLGDEGLSEITSYSQYAEIVVRHPLRMAASYALHTFNGLDVRYPTPYVQDLGSSPLILRLLLYTLLFLAFLRLVLPDARRALGTIRWLGLAVLVVPVLSAIPGAVEPRFFLPVHVLGYMLVCFGAGSVLGETAVRRIAIAASYAVFLVLCFGLSSATKSQIEYPLASADHRRSRISSGPAVATTTNPWRSSSGRTSGTALSRPMSPV